MAQAIHELIDHSAENDRRIEQMLAELKRLGGEIERQRGRARFDANYRGSNS